MKDEILERIFVNTEMQTILLGCQSTAVSAISEILEKIKEETLMSEYPSYLNSSAQAVQSIYPNYNIQQQMNPYIDRFVQNQQIQQMNQIQNQPTQQTQRLNERIVNDFNVITLNDVSMYAMGALFIKSDIMETQQRVWISNGTIAISRFKLVLEEQVITTRIRKSCI